MTVWKPTQAECDLIRRQAQRESLPSLKLGNICLEPGVRWNIDDADVPHHLNIARVSKDGIGEDTDLDDFATWATFRAGVELTEDGRAEVDFYIRSIRPHESGDSLFGNVWVHYAAGRIVSIHGFGGGGDWTAAEERGE